MLLERLPGGQQWELAMDAPPAFWKVVVTIKLRRANHAIPQSSWLNRLASLKAALGAVGFEPTTTNIMEETIEKGVKKERRRQKERSGRGGGGV